MALPGCTNLLNYLAIVFRIVLVYQSAVYTIVIAVCRRCNLWWCNLPSPLLQLWGVPQDPCWQAVLQVSRWQPAASMSWLLWSSVCQKVLSLRSVDYCIISLLYGSWGSSLAWDLLHMFSMQIIPVRGRVLSTRWGTSVCQLWLTVTLLAVTVSTKLVGFVELVA